jgi:hypothetical protein
VDYFISPSQQSSTIIINTIFNIWSVININPFYNLHKIYLINREEKTRVSISYSLAIH